MKVTLEIPEEIVSSEVTASEVRYILCDAIYEFQAARRGDYVEKRYSNMPEAFRKNKKVSNERRLRVSEILHRACFSVTISE